MSSLLYTTLSSLNMLLFKNVLLGLYPGYARALIMPKSKAFSSQGLRSSSPKRVFCL